MRSFHDISRQPPPPGAKAKADTGGKACSFKVKSVESYAFADWPERRWRALGHCGVDNQQPTDKGRDKG
jgi:hypothetical protein